MGRLRVQVVDDAVVVRKMLSDVLAQDPDLEVVAVSANGRIALARIPLANPDLVVLDVMMPDMDGLATLSEIRKQWPGLPVIMFSNLTEKGASATLDALARGANDYVTKPANFSSPQDALNHIRAELVPRIKALCRMPPDRGPADRTSSHQIGPDRGSTSAREMPPRPMARPLTPPPRPPVEAAQRSGRIDVLAIGVSTGGPNALADLIPTLPGDLPVPVVIVQHMPPVFTRLLAERLDQKSRLKVVEGTDGMVVEVGKVYLAPGDYHMVLVREGAQLRIRLNQGPPENSCRPAVDVLFRSVAEVYGGKSLAVILTGMGQDGLRGCEVIKEVGGQILAQDEASSVVWGMPGFVARAGLAEKILPLDKIGEEIVRRIAVGKSMRLSPVSMRA